MTVDPVTLATIIAMGLVTWLTRIAGTFLAGRLVLEGRAKAAFDAIPPVVLMAVVAPTVFATGIAETLAALVTAVAATRLPLLATILVGVVSVVILRAIV
ncbi:MAG: AzlD domain-containing protein [Bauldia sp.]